MTSFEAQICYSMGGPWLTVAVALTHRGALAGAARAWGARDPWNRIPLEARIIETRHRARG
jgi:hypothetical protein